MKINSKIFNQKLLIPYFISIFNKKPIEIHSSLLINTDFFLKIFLIGALFLKQFCLLKRHLHIHLLDKMANIIHSLADSPAQIIEIHIDDKLQVTFAVVLVWNIEIYRFLTIAYVNVGFNWSKIYSWWTT